MNHLLTAILKPSIKASVWILCFLIVAAARGEVVPGCLFRDHCILQRGIPAPVWGAASPGEKITVTLAGQTKTTVAGPEGKWMLKLDPLKENASAADLTISGTNTVTVHDVLVGEVWVAAGQSNMAYMMKRAGDFSAADIASANDPLLRCIDVPDAASLKSQSSFPGQWYPAIPQCVQNFSAVAYYYAKNLRQTLGVPVGLISASVGGTPIESWTSRQAQENRPEFKEETLRKIAEMEQFPEQSKAFPGALKKWTEEYGAEDKENAGAAHGWQKPEFDDSAWKTARIPHCIRHLGFNGGGIVWYRKNIVLSALGAGQQEFELNVGWISGAMHAYVNGVEVEHIGDKPWFGVTQHRFGVPATLIRPGQPNTVALRLYGLTSLATMWVESKHMGLPAANPEALDNQWKYAIEKRFPNLTAAAVATLPKQPTACIYFTPGGIFNGMIAPLIPYGIRGAIWYQGENNTPPAMAPTYRDRLSLMIGDWRSRWGQGEFPFYLVQLANYFKSAKEPGESGVAVVREAQLRVAQQVPNTGMAVAIDVGEEDIHPRNKRDVGQRLALVALAKTYGKPVEYSGPVYKSMTVEGTTIRVRFEHGEALAARGGDLKQFAIAGADKKFVWADAKIDGDSVVVSSPRIPNPVAVRYAWAGNPEGCNLYNKAGLPASPFRTDAQPAP